MKDLEFHVSEAGKSKPSTGRWSDTRIFTSFDKAAGHAIALACSHGMPMEIDVVAWSRAAAKAWGGDSAVEVYDDDPDASVHERIIIKAESQGHVA